jgi:hypothetical protein
VSAARRAALRRAGPVVGHARSLRANVVGSHGVLRQEPRHPSSDGLGTLDVQEMAHPVDRALLDVRDISLMNKASMQRRVWESVSQLKVTYRNGPLGRPARKWFSGQGPRPGR